MYSSQVLILDSAPIIKSAPFLARLAKEFITVPEVLSELKDRATKESLLTLSYTITTKTPSEEAMKHVVQFSKKTGDYASLSLTDIKVLALTLQLEWERVGRDHLRSDPSTSHDIVSGTNATPTANTTRETAPKKKRNRKRKKIISIDGCATPESVGDKEENEMADVTDLENGIGKIQIQQIELEENKSEEQALDIAQEDSPDSSSDEDGGEWITPSNVAKKKQLDTYGTASSVKAPEEVTVACITNDFAMQNVLLQMKLSLLSVDGMLITRLKTWVLRCHACFKVTAILDKTFCPSCGNVTLIRTSVGVDHNGKMKLHLKKNFHYRNRGTVYAIPAPKGGRHSTDLILREDQNEHQKALKLKKIYEKRALNRDLDIESLTMFGSSPLLNATGAPVIGYGRKNPNEVRGRRRK